MRISIVLFSLLLGSSSAIAHGDAEWIQNDDRYRDMDDSSIHCCGPSDCHTWPAADIELKPGGYLVKSLNKFINANKVYITRPDKIDISEFWLCLRGNMSVRCLFVPGGGA